MSLIDRLRALGGRLGIIHAASAPSAGGPVKIATRTVSLDILCRELRDQRLALFAASPDVLSRSFAAIDEAAGIAPPAHGWTVDRLAALLRSERCAGRPREQVQAEILAAWTEASVEADDVVADALARDRALDAYAVGAREALAQRVVGRQQRREEIADAMRALDAERTRLAAEDQADRDQWSAWWNRKLAREQELAWAIGHVLNHPVVSVDLALPDIAPPGSAHPTVDADAAHTRSDPP